MKSLAYETRKMLMSLDRYWKYHPDSYEQPYGEHDTEYYWSLFEKRRERVEKLLDEEKEKQR